MAYNNGDVRRSKDESSTVNGNAYVTVANAYYKSTQYSDDTPMHVIDDIFEQTIPVFNAVPKVVNIASALATGGEISPDYEDADYVQNIIDKLGLNQEKTFMTKDLILSKSILVELIDTSVENAVSDEEIERDQETVDADFPYQLSYYPSDEYEIISEGDNILYAKVQGYKLTLNGTKDNYVRTRVDKVFIKLDDGTAMSYTLAGGVKDDIVEYDTGFLPLVEIRTTYDMTQLFYSIDRYNELEAFIKNIFYLAGEPILFGSGVERIKDKSAEIIGDDRYKRQKSMFSKNESANLRMLEITGSSTSIMISKQEKLIEAIIKDYPEYSISDVLSGSNVSEETTRIRLTEILSRVQGVRKNIEIGLNKLIGLIAVSEGKDMSKEFITIDNLMDTDINGIMTVVTTALQNKLISRKSAMYQIRSLFISEDVENEQKEIDKDTQDAIDTQTALTGGNTDDTDDTDSDNPINNLNK